MFWRWKSSNKWNYALSQEFRDKILKFDVEAHNQLQSTYNVDASVFGGEKEYLKFIINRLNFLKLHFLYCFIIKVILYFS